MTPKKARLHPLKALPMLRKLIDEGLENNKTQLQNLLQAREKPHVLDDALLEQVQDFYQREVEVNGDYKAQLASWKKAPLSYEQKNEIERLEKQLARNQEVCDEIFSLVDELKKGTINRILEKDDLQLALEVLSGKIKLPF